MSCSPLSGGLDWFRLPAALLVVANHTSPLLAFSPEADHVLTQILARVAVPFFLTVSGYFLLPKAEREGRRAVCPFLRRTLLLYLCATLFYLPLQLYKGHRPGLLGALRDLVFDGTFYHLWYFPALLVGLSLVCLLPRRARWPVSALLYLMGLLGDSYYALAAAFPPLRICYDVLFHIFDQTRNGLFLAPLFLVLGGALAHRPSTRNRSARLAALIGALLLLLAEGRMVFSLALARYSTMYLSLPLVLWLLFRFLQSLDLPPRPGLRPLSTAVYLLHPWLIVALRGFARLTGLDAK